LIILIITPLLLLADIIAIIDIDKILLFSTLRHYWH
jgi:hypothetical protein